MHVNDVGPDGHVHREGDVESSGGRSHAMVHERRLSVREKAPDRLAQPEAPLHAIGDRSVQQQGRFLGHAETARAERLIDILRRGPANGDLEIVDDAGAVGRKCRDETPFHQVDEDRRQARFQHVGANAPYNRRTAPARVRHRRHDRLEISGRQKGRQRSQQAGHTAPLPVRRRKVCDVRLALARRQRIGLHRT